MRPDAPLVLATAIMFGYAVCASPSPTTSGLAPVVPAIVAQPAQPSVSKQMPLSLLAGITVSGRSLLAGDVAASALCSVSPTAQAALLPPPPVSPTIDTADLPTMGAPAPADTAGAALEIAPDPWMARAMMVAAAAAADATAADAVVAGAGTGEGEPERSAEAAPQASSGRAEADADAVLVVQGQPAVAVTAAPEVPVVETIAAKASAAKIPAPSNPGGEIRLAGADVPVVDPVYVEGGAGVDVPTSPVPPDAAEPRPCVGAGESRGADGTCIAKPAPKAAARKPAKAAKGPAPEPMKPITVAAKAPPPARGANRPAPRHQEDVEAPAVPGQHLGNGHLVMSNVHTGESIDITYRQDGGKGTLDPEAMKRINWFFRDHHVSGSQQSSEARLARAKADLEAARSNPDLLLADFNAGDTVAARKTRVAEERVHRAERMLASVERDLNEGGRSAAATMDPRLIDLLSELQRRFGGRPMVLLSGYRSPQTNLAMHYANGGAALDSQHQYGRASDIYIPGVPLKTLHSAAVALKAGGVGYYGRSRFVHVDVAGVRYWWPEGRP